MSGSKLSMRKIRVILSMKWDLKRPHREIADSVGVSSSTISDVINRAKSVGLTWPLSADMDDDELENKLYPHVGSVSDLERGVIDYPYIYKELKRKGVTLALLWIEYKTQNPNGYRYSYYCEKYNKYLKSLDVDMRQTHKAGEKLFIDYSGMTMQVIVAGEVRKAEIFIAVCGASGYFYIEATFTQTLADWIQSHCNAFEYFGGVPELLIPDNLKSAIKKSHRYDPDCNPTYHEMARHFSTAIMPARVRSPKDKSKAEQVVQQTERQILAALRNQQFFSLDELNRALRAKAEEVNAKPFQKMPGSRRSLFEEIEKNALKPLPAVPYTYAEWSYASAGRDYHVNIDDHHYSVPYQYKQKKLNIRLTSTSIECYYKGKSIASHLRSYDKGKSTTLMEHMPKSHQEYSKWTPQAVIDEAKTIGEATLDLVKRNYAERDHVFQATRACLGIVRLKKHYCETRLEAACKRAIAINSVTYRSVESILKNKLDQQPLPNAKTEPANRAHQIEHNHVRGGEYFK